MEALIFNTQGYSIHDGGGIRTILFFKGCPLACAWCSNPESQKFEPEFEFNETDCMGCGLCVSECPTQVRKAPGINVSGCNGCYTCVDVCPTAALKLNGKKYTVEGALKLALKDKEFYNQSGGGVTFSGGEALCHAEFISELTDALHKENVNVALETCGALPWEKIEKAIGKIDTVLYDVKHMDSALHKKYTGMGNELILENARKIAAVKGGKMIIRIPLIGGVNADTENIRKTGEFAKEIGVREIHLLPYHRFGEPKYKKLGKQYGGDEFYTPTEEQQEALAAMLKDMGITVDIGG
ncbi:glycyl-radical enzyme activating protein [Christensenellaceae bacterium]|nr:glycyl-radical enzyme activating protein [Christensenellaceae bacterium]BDF60498.1 glycyl-radical enzyme activating protein [Christensenellaceae bacterium]